MASNSDRLKLPLMAAAQAQKEIVHNEALALADIAMMPVVVASGINTPPVAATPGQCWIVGSAPVGDWTGQAGALAGWTAGGWRFLAAFEGMRAWSIADQCEVRRGAAGWLTGVVDALSIRVGGTQVVGSQSGAIATPTGGTTADAEGRAAIGAILTSLRHHGLIA